MKCADPGCDRPGTDERGGVVLCFAHWLLAVMREQPRVEEGAASCT